MIGEENGVDYAIYTYASVIFFLGNAYGMDDESKKHEKLENDIATLVKNSKIKRREHELELAIIVFAIIESQSSHEGLESSLKIFTDLLSSNSITTAIQLEKFLCLDESIAYEDLVKTIQKRKVDLNFDLSNTSLWTEDDNIVLQQNEKQLTIKCSE